MKVNCNFKIKFILFHYKKRQKGDKKATKGDKKATNCRQKNREVEKGDRWRFLFCPVGAHPRLKTAEDGKRGLKTGQGS